MENIREERRKRHQNWNGKEKALLRLCMKPHIDAIENNSLLTDALKAKEDAWNTVAMEFNTLNTRFRDTIQLKSQWKTHKLGVRKRLAIYRRQLFEAKHPNTLFSTKPPIQRYNIKYFNSSPENLASLYDLTSKHMITEHKKKIWIMEQKRKDSAKMKEEELKVKIYLAKKENALRLQLMEEEHKLKICLIEIEHRKRLELMEQMKHF